MAAKRLNKNLVVGLTLFAFAMMIVLSVLMLMQLQRRDPQYFVDLAQRYEQNEEWRSAALFYRKAWERSRDATFLVSYGDMLLNQGELGLAIGSLREALVNEPELTRAHIRQLELLLELAKLYRRLDDWERVREAADTFLASGAERTKQQEAFAQNAKGLSLISLALRNEANRARGETALRRAVELAPDQVGYALDEVGYYLDSKRTDEGEAMLKRLLRRFSGSDAAAARVRRVYAEFLATVGRDDEAEAQFRDALELAADTPEALMEVRLGYASFLTRRWAQVREDQEETQAAEQLFAAAESLLEECLAEDPEAFEPYLQLVTLYGAAQRHEDVVAVCAARLARGFSRGGVEGRRHQLDTFSLMIHASTACSNEAMVAERDGDPAARDEWLRRAEQYLADARGEFPAHPRVLSQSGRIKLVRGLDREALEDLRRADEGYRSYDTINWDNKMTLARVHLKLNEAGAAKSVLSDVLDDAQRYRGQDPAFWTLYAQVLFANNDLERALAVTDRVLAFAPGRADALRLKAAVYERQGRREEAGRIVEQLTGDHIIRDMLSAQQLILDGDTESGIRVLRDALAEDPADPRLVWLTVRTLANAERLPEARSIVEHALEIRPEDKKLQRLLVLTREDLSAEEREAATLALIESEEDGYQRALDLIAFHGRRGEFVAVLRWIDEALKHIMAKDTPVARSSTRLQHRVLLEAKLRVGATVNNEEAMIAARDAAAANNVDGADGKSIAGLFYMHRKEYEQAAQLLTEAIESQPTDANSLGRLGQCLQMLGRHDEAQQAYERALRVNPDSGTAHKGLASLAKLRGDEATFRRELSICQRLIPNDDWVAARALELEEEADPARAIARREVQLAENPDDTENLRRLVELCESEGDLRKADEYLDRLLSGLPDSKDVFVMASRYFRRTGRPDRSLEVARRFAESRTTADERANAQILIASHHLGLDQLDDVEATLLSAAKTSETLEVCQSLADFYLRRMEEPDKALTWYDKAIGHARTSGAARLPQLLAARISCLLHREINDIDTAWTYVSELRTAFPDHLEGLLLESEVHGRTGRIDEAIGSLTEYIARRPNDPVALYQRALLHRALGNTLSAIEDLSAIKRVDPLALDLKPRLLLARLYRQSDQADRQLRELESLVQDAPDSADALETLARAYIEHNRPADAERIATAQINRAPDRPDARWFFLRGRISIELGDRRGALSDFQRGAELTGYAADAVAEVLALYAQLDRASEGIAYFERVVGDEPVTAMLAARHATLFAKAGNDARAVKAFRRAMASAEEEGPTARASVVASLLTAYRPVPPDFALTNRAIALFEQQAASGQAERSNDRILVKLLIAARRYDEAAARLDALIQSSADDRERVDLLFELGELHQMHGSPQRAREAYERGLEYDPDNWMALNNLAYLLSDALGEYAQARPYAQRAVALADNPVTLDTLGWIYVGLGEYSLAVAELSRAVRLAPNDALSYYHLGEAYRRNGQFAAAKDILASGLKLARDAGDVALTVKIESALDRAAASAATKPAGRGEPE